MDGLRAADIKIVLIHTLINMLLMYRTGAVWLSEETSIGSTAALSTVHCTMIGFSYRGFFDNAENDENEHHYNSINNYSIDKKH